MRPIVLGVALGIMLTVLTGTAFSKDYRVWNDPGGLISSHEEKWKQISKSGRRVQILGYCASACTLFMKFIPRERVCVGLHGELAFHPAFEKRGGKRVYSKEGTEYVLKQYPADVQKWIRDRGGVGEDVTKLTLLRGKELRKFFKAC